MKSKINKTIKTITGVNQTLYDSYTSIENNFYQLFSEYQDHLERLDLKPKWKIKHEEMEMVDRIASKTESALESYTSIKSKMSREFETILQKTMNKELIAKSYTYTIEDELSLDSGRTMISDAKELFIADQLVLAIEKIIQAENFFFQLILKIRNRWLKMHGERIKTLNQYKLNYPN